MTVVVLCAVLGGVAGAVVPRVAYRMSVDYGHSPRSSCTGCAHPLDPGLAGWIRISGRCARCRLRLGPRAWVTAPAGAAATGLLALALAGDGPIVLAAFVAVAVAGVLLAAIDLACLRLPDPLVGAAGLIALLLLGAAAMAGNDPGPLLRGLAGAGALGGGYLLLALLSGGQLGLGDVKLAAVLGLLLGWLGWGAVLIGALLPHLINGPIALVLLASGRAGRRTELPLGPALLVAALAAAVIAG